MTRKGGEFTPPVTVLKPLKGVDDRLLDNLESFCRQDYPEYEIVFCVRSPSDPALRVAHRIRDNFPERPISVVAGSRAGLNPKVANLIPGYARARHPLVLISDSNVAVGAGYLREAGKGPGAGAGVAMPARSRQGASRREKSRGTTRRRVLSVISNRTGRGPR